MTALQELDLSHNELVGEQAHNGGTTQQTTNQPSDRFPRATLNVHLQWSAAVLLAGGSTAAVPMGHAAILCYFSAAVAPI